MTPHDLSIESYNMTNVLLVGANGGPNFGDESIMRAWIAFIKQARPDVKIYCDGWNLNGLHKILDCEAEVINPLGSFWGRVWRQKFDNKSVEWLQVEENLYDKEFYGECQEAINILKAHNISNIHLIGGGYINNIWPQNYMLILLAVLAKRYLKAKIFMTGQGLCPPLSDFADSLTKGFSELDHVDVRDNESAQLLGSSGAVRYSHTGDDALLYFSGAIRPPVRLLSQKALVLSLQNELFPGNITARDIISPELVRFCKKFNMQKIIYVVSMQGDVFSPDLATISSLNDAGIVFETCDPFELLQNGMPVSQQGLMITSRYHSHFFAALSETPGIALCANDYYNIKHLSVRAAGSQWPIISDFTDIKYIIDAVERVCAPDFKPCDTKLRDEMVRNKIQLARNVLAL